MTQNKTYHGECVISQRRSSETALRWRRTTSFQKNWKISQGECPSCFLKNKQNLNRQDSVLYCALLSHSVGSNSSRLHGLYPTRLLCPWDFPSKNTGVGFHFLLQRIFPTGELNGALLHCRRILYQLSYQGSPNCVWRNIPSVHKYLLSVGFLFVCLFVCFFPRQSLHPRNTVGKILKKDFVLGLFIFLFYF